MQYRKLGRSGIDVSRICLGTMTWGTQNDEAQAHEQMDYALSRGINFWDTAEMYPTTPRTAATTGRTEEIVGSWFAKTRRRDEVVLATKITGEGNNDIRSGELITGDSMRRALEGSLKRLKTDYVDLYQLHWPNRGSYHFRKLWQFDATGQDKSGAVQENILDVLETAGELVRQGKIRTLGLSNESAWGTMQFLQVAENHGLPRVASVQNEYSLLCRVFDSDMAELSHHEDVGLMAFSPLAAGLLSGKYLSGEVPAGTRLSIQPSLNGRYNEYSRLAIAAYAEVAKKHGLDMAQMALAFCLTRPFTMSVIVGATCMDQLKTDITSIEVELGEDVLADIAEVRRRHPMPI
ncbi:MAG: aldo/keto reductase [Nitratireductor sp.]|nr:aldo/keto reductase [Nitratireductor sp.]